MAGLIGHINSDDVSLAASTAKTVLQITAPANHRLKIRKVAVFLEGQVTTDPMVRIAYTRQTAGSGSGSTAVTPIKHDPGWDETLQATAAKDFGTEPTAGNVLHIERVHPQTGYIRDYPLGREEVVPGGGALGLVFTAGANVSATVEIEYEE